MNKGRWIGIGALCALTVMGPVAVFADAGKPVLSIQDTDKTTTLTRTAKVGDSVRYQKVLEIAVGGQDVKVEQNHKQTIKEVKESGEEVIEVADEGTKIIAGADSNEVPPNALVTVTRDKSGKILTFKSSSDDPYLSASTLHLLTIADEVVFPDKPVKEGYSRKTEVENPAVKNKKATITTTFVSAEKVDGVDVWKVKQNLEAETDSGRMKSEFLALIEVATGQTISGEQTITGVPTTMGPLDWTAKLKRVKAAEKAIAATK